MEVITWILFFLALGIINLPLTRLTLPNLADRGWIFSRIIAVMLIGYFSWLLGMLKILPFSQLSILTLVLLLFGLNLVIERASKKPWFGSIPLKTFILEEIIFIGGFTFWVFIRSHNPDIHDLEKYMDFGFINSILRSDYFPPKDMWLSGGTINYYYFGHLISALFIKALGTRPEIGYNLTLSLLFALTLSASFSIGYNISEIDKKKAQLFALLSGFVTAVTLTLLGNLQVIYALIRGLTNYWYPDATRFIPNTIHEFPIYSFVVADLHGHLFDIPFVLLMIIFLFSNFFTEIESNHQKDDEALEKSNTLLKYFFPGFILAVMYMTNVADSLIYAGLFSLVSVFHKKFNLVKNIRNISLLINKSKPIALTAVLLFAFSLPFQLTFKPFAQGIRIATEHTPLWMFLIIWGFSLYFSLTFVVSYLKKVFEATPSDNFIFLVSIFSFILIIIPEIIYFKDIYTGQPRANTMFKFGYQAFMLFSLVSAYTFVKILAESISKFNPRRLVWLLIGINLFEIMAIYPYLAIRGAYGKNLFENVKGLDGLRYLSLIRPSDYEGIKWINKNISDQPVVLEAVGESYTDFSRISANTGLPTVLGWPVHEWLWRNDAKVTEVRRTDIETIYNTTDLIEAKRLLSFYKVKYAYIGLLEKEKYPELDENKFRLLGNVIYGNESVRIYKITNDQ